jgi:hypothetical protein
LIVVGGDEDDRYDDGVWYAPRRSLLRSVPGLAPVTPFTLREYAHGGRNNPLGIESLLCIGGPSFCEALEMCHPGCIRAVHVSLHEGPKNGRYQKAPSGSGQILHRGKQVLQWKAPFAGSREWHEAGPAHYEERGYDRLVRVTLQRRDPDLRWLEGESLHYETFDDLLDRQRSRYYQR